MSLVAERAALKAMVDQYTKRIKEIDGWIIEELAGREEAVIDGYRITYKIVVRKAFMSPETIFPKLTVKRDEIPAMVLHAAE